MRAAATYVLFLAHLIQVRAADSRLAPPLEGNLGSEMSRDRAGCVLSSDSSRARQPKRIFNKKRLIWPT